MKVIMYALLYVYEWTDGQVLKRLNLQLRTFFEKNIFFLKHL